MCVAPTANPYLRRGLGIATGGLSRVAEAAQGGDPLGAIDSVASGGLSDLVGVGGPSGIANLGKNVAAEGKTLVPGNNPPPSTLDEGAAKRAKLPSVQDETQRKARAAEMQRLLSGRGRAASFLTGPGGVSR